MVATGVLSLSHPTTAVPMAVLVTVCSLLALAVAVRHVSRSAV
jgi:hypothetical protein